MHISLTLLFMVGCLSGQPASAEREFSWDDGMPGSHSWTWALNWDPNIGGPPSEYDLVRIDSAQKHWVEVDFPTEIGFLDIPLTGTWVGRAILGSDPGDVGKIKLENAFYPDGDVVVGDYGTGRIYGSGEDAIMVNHDSFTSGYGPGESTMTLGRQAGSEGSVVLENGAYFNWEGEVDDPIGNDGDVLVVGDQGDGSFEVYSGTEVLTSQVHIGRGTGGLGSIEVSGTDTTWGSQGELTIGYYGDGRLWVKDNAEFVNDMIVLLGKETISQGSLTVEGNALFQTPDDIVAGGGGYGTLSAASGGRIEARDIFVGQGGAGNVILSDGGQISTGSLQIGVTPLPVELAGHQVSGGLQTQAGSTVNITDFDMAVQDGSTAHAYLAGTLNVSGQSRIGVGGSADVEFAGDLNFTTHLSLGHDTTGEAEAKFYSGDLSTPNLLIGNSGTASLVWRALGGTPTLDAGAVYVGKGATGNGSLVIEDLTITPTFDLIVGDAGTGEVTQVQSDVTLSSALELGSQVGGSGSYTVTTRVSDAALSVPSLVVGKAGSGDFQQYRQNNGTNATVAVTGDLVIGQDATSDGSYSLGYQAGTLTVGGDMYVGLSGNGSFTTNSDTTTTITGALAVGSNAGSSSQVTHHGGAVTAHSLTVGDAGTGSYYVRSGQATYGEVRIGLSDGAAGTVTQPTASTFTANGSMRIGNDAGAVGVYNLTPLYDHSAWLNANPQLTCNDWAVIGYEGDGTLNQQLGTVTVSAAQPMFIAENTGSTGLYDMSGGSSIIHSSLYVGGGLAQGGAGELDISGTAGMTVSNTLKIWGTGTVSLEGGFLDVDTIENTDGGTFSFTGGTLSVETFNGDLANNGGRLAPGSSPGMTTINGNYTMGTDSVLAMELGGITQTTEYDYLNVNGDITFGGELSLSLVDGFTPTNGQSFDLIDWTGTSSGAFQAYQLPTLSDPGWVWLTGDLATDGTIAILNTIQGITWDGDPAGWGNWTEASNWDPELLPRSDAAAKINNGGSVVINEGEGGTSKTLTLGETATDEGTLEAYGDLSVLGKLTVGGGGTGSLEAYGHLRSQQGSIAEQVGSSGDVIVWGGTWDNSGDLHVGGGTGGAGGTGDLTVQSLGELNIDGTLNVHSGGTVTLYGGSTITTQAFDTQDGTFNWVGGGIVNFTGDLTIDAGEPFGDRVVIDESSRLNVADWLQVGEALPGSLSVTDFAHASADVVIIGLQGAADATVSGADARIDARENMYVGAFSEATLDILSGGSVTAQNFSIGYDSNATDGNGDGLVTVSGDGSSLDVAGELRVGNAGTGELRVEAGGDVSADDLAVAFIGGQGSLTVTGTGSTVDSQGFGMSVFTGSGALLVDDGGVFTNANDTTIGRMYSSVDAVCDATANVRGAGSLWDNGGNMLVGGGDSVGATVPGTGQVTVEDAGELRIGGTLSVAEGSSVTVQNGGVLTAAGLSLSTTLGAGTNSITVQSGATFDNAGTALLAANSDTTSTALVTGEGATWINSGALYIGGTADAAAGNADMTVADGGALTVSNALTVWNTSSLDVTGGQLTVEGPFQINGQAAFSGGNAETQDDVRVGDATAGTDGSLTVSDSGNLSIGRDLEVGSGQMDMTGGTVSVDNGKLTANAPLAISGGVLSVNNAIVSQTTLTLSGGRIDVAGTWRLGGTAGAGNLTINGTGAMSADVVDVERGTLSLEAGSLTADTLSVQPAGPDTGGTLLVSGGTLNVNTLETDTFVHNGGTFQIGSSPGSSMIDGDYTMGSAVVLPMELGGTATGTEHDHMTVTGTMTQNGTLDVVYWDGFTAARGDRFDLFEWGARAGDFATVNLPSLNTDLYWDMNAFVTAGDIAVASTVSDRIWDGDGSGDQWEAAANWSEDEVPTVVQDVQISDGSSVAIGTGVVAQCLSLAVGEHAGQSGDFTVSGGTMTVADSVVVGGDGLGTASISDGLMTVGSVIGVGNGSSLSLNGGTLMGQTLFVDLDGTFSFTGGDLFLTAFMGDLTVSAGTLHPGASPGLLQVTGDYVQEAGSTLEIEIGGLSRGTEYDALDVTGDVALGGNLEVLFVDGFVPQSLETFSFLTWGGTLTGAFDSITLPTLTDPDLRWDTSRFYTTGFLTIIPEPDTIVLLSMATLVSALSRRSNRWSETRSGPSSLSGPQVH